MFPYLGDLTVCLVAWRVQNGVPALFCFEESSANLHRLAFRSLLFGQIKCP